MTSEATTIRCPQCGRRYRLDAGRLLREGRRFVKCNACQQVIEIEQPASSPVRRGSPAPRKPQTSPAPGETLEAIRGSFKKLYPMPHVMLKARRLLGDPEVDLQEVARVIKTDQALAGRILKVTNSPYFGLNQKVSTLSHAMALVGTRLLTQIIDIVSHSKMLRGPLQAYGLQSGEIWRHSLTTAVAADTLATRASADAAEEAFLAGLLHDSGKLLLNPFLLEHWTSFRSLLKEPGLSMSEAERGTLDLDHGQAGAELCQHWHLPEALALGIRQHHDPAAPDAQPLAAILCLADGIAHGRSPSDEEHPLEANHTEAMERLGLEASALEHCALQTLQAVEILEGDTYPT